MKKNAPQLRLTIALDEESLAIVVALAAAMSATSGEKPNISMAQRRINREWAAAHAYQPANGETK